MNKKIIKIVFHRGFRVLRGEINIQIMKKTLIILLLGIFIVAGYIFSHQDADLPVEESVPVVAQNVEEEKETEVTEESNLQKMQGKYASLKEARKELKLTLSRLASRLRKAEFSPEQAADIGKLMRKANYALKNPKLLGAFSSVDQIEQELEKVQSLQHNLQEVRLLLDEMRENKH